MGSLNIGQVEIGGGTFGGTLEILILFIINYQKGAASILLTPPHSKSQEIPGIFLPVESTVSQ
jgi:hypothetical protein